MRIYFARAIEMISIIYPVAFGAIYSIKRSLMVPWPFALWSCLSIFLARALAQSLRDLQIVKLNAAGTRWEGQPFKYAFVLGGHLLLIVIINIVFSISALNY